MAKTKGFRLKSDAESVDVNFAEGHRLHGLTLTVKKRVPVGIALGLRSGDPVRAIEPFVAQIISWNLEDDDGNPVPVTKDAFDQAFDIEETFELIRGWAEGVGAQVETPLVEP